MANEKRNNSAQELAEKHTQLRADGGSSKEEEKTQLSDTTGTRAGEANSLTGLIDQTLENQNDREETARQAINDWESNASRETDKVLEQYGRLQESVSEAVDWNLTAETPAGELVDDLEFDSEKGAAEYAQTQSEQIEGLTGTVRRFGNMIDVKENEIEEVREEISELEEEREEGYQSVQQQIAQMDDEDFPEETSPSEYVDSERDSIDSSIDQQIEQLEEEISGLQSTKGDHMDTKMDAAGERAVRRNEAQQVYNEFAGEAEQTVRENTRKLRDSLGVLRELGTQQEIHESASVEDGILDQGQGDQAYARRETAMAYVAEALEEIDEIGSAVEDHNRVVGNLTDITQVETRELEDIYSELADEGSIDEELDSDQYGIETLRQRVFEAAKSISDDGYDSVRELRELADKQAGYIE